MQLKLLQKKAIQKAVTWNEIAKTSKRSPQTNSENETEIPKERYISPEKSPQTIDELRLTL